MTAYIVVGAGAIGGTLAFRLARAGHDVTVVDADSEHVQAIARTGLTLVRADEKETVHVGRAVTPEEWTGELGRVLLAVKAQATEDAVDWIAPRLAADGFVASLQNGLNEPTIRHRVGAQRTVGAFVNLFADVVGPGEIRDGGPGALVVGELNGAQTNRVDELADHLGARVTSNVFGYLWAKLGFGAMLVATALTDAPMADLIDRDRAAMHELVAEVFAVATAEGIRLEPFDAFDPHAYTGTDEAAKDAATDRLVKWLRTQAKDRSGIWRDLWVRRRPTEVSVHYQPVLGLAREYGIATPRLTELLARIEAVEKELAQPTR